LAKLRVSIRPGPCGCRRLEQGLATADGDRVDEDPVLVDQVVAAEGGGQVGPTRP